MVTGLGERVALRHALIGAALSVLTAEHNLSDEAASGTALLKAEEALELAAQDLTSTIDGLPLTARPRGWVLTP